MFSKLSFLLVLNLFVFSFNGNKETGDPVISKTIPDKDLFDSDEILSITLSGNIRQLLNDRADKSTYHPIALSYREKDSSEVNIPVQMKTRGHFRKIKGNCKYPPLQISFPVVLVFVPLQMPCFLPPFFSHPRAGYHKMETVAFYF